jgi:hypothetical protein
MDSPGQVIADLPQRPVANAGVALQQPFDLWIQVVEMSEI